MALKWQVGDVSITQVVELTTSSLGPYLLPQATPEALAALPWLKPFVSEGKIVLSIHALVIESQGQTLMLDPCIGNDKERTYPRWNRMQTDFLDRFAAVQLTPEPVIDISGATGVPLMLALAHGEDWRGHAPGPNGLPGGYPVKLEAGRLELDLPDRLEPEDAVAWNVRFEADNGLVLRDDGRACYTGLLRERLRQASPELAEGFAVGDLEAVYGEMDALRTRLQERPSLP